MQFRRELKATVDWICKLYLWTLIKSTIVLSTQFPYFRHQDLFLPHITRPQIRAHYTKRQLFFQPDFRLLFSILVQRVRRSCHKKPIVSTAYSVLFFFSSAESGHNCDYCLLYYAASMSYVCAFHTTGLSGLSWRPRSTICFGRTTKQELIYDSQFHCSAPLSFRSNWSDRRTEFDGGSGP